MKKIFLFAILIAAFTISSYAQDNKKPLSPPDSVENSLVKIVYCKPSVRGRKIFGPDKSYLQPYGQIWRVGANAATTIEVKEDILFGGKLLKKGKYALYSIPNADEWTIIVNGNPNQWGTDYEKNKDQDLFHIMVKPENLSTPQETMSITLEGKHIVIRWANTEIKIEIKKA